jgi:hypothetical protein
MVAYRLEPEVPHTKRHHFLDSYAGIEHRREERIVATSIGGGPVDRREHRLDLVELQVLDGTRARALEWNGQHALAQLKSAGMLRRAVPKEGVK